MARLPKPNLKLSKPSLKLPKASLKVPSRGAPEGPPKEEPKSLTFVPLEYRPAGGRPAEPVRAAEPVPVAAAVVPEPVVAPPAPEEPVRDVVPEAPFAAVPEPSPAAPEAAKGGMAARFRLPSRKAADGALADIRGLAGKVQLPFGRKKAAPVDPDAAPGAPTPAPAPEAPPPPEAEKKSRLPSFLRKAEREAAPAAMAEPAGEAAPAEAPKASKLALLRKKAMPAPSTEASPAPAAEPASPPSTEAPKKRGFHIGRKPAAPEPSPPAVVPASPVPAPAMPAPVAQPPPTEASLLPRPAERPAAAPPAPSPTFSAPVGEVPAAARGVSDVPEPAPVLAPARAWAPADYDRVHLRVDRILGERARARPARVDDRELSEKVDEVLRAKAPKAKASAKRSGSRKR